MATTPEPVPLGLRRTRDHIHLAVALGGSALREPGRAPSAPGGWVRLVREAEAGLVDLVTIDVPPGSDALDDDPAATDLAAVRVAARAASATRRIALVPTVHAGRSEPGRLARAVQSLHRESGGRAGVQLRVPVRSDEDGWVTAVRRHWDPQDAPLVALPGRGRPGRCAVSRLADLAFVTPPDAAGAARAAAAATASGARAHLLGDVVVVLEDDARRALVRAERVAADGALLFAGTAAQLADLAQEWRAAGLSGLRLHPADPVRDLRGVTRSLVPELQRRGAFHASCGERSTTGRSTTGRSTTGRCPAAGDPAAA